MRKFEKVYEKYLFEAPGDPMAGGAPGGMPPAAPAPGGPMGDPMAGGGMPGQQQTPVPNQLPGDPAGAMKFTQLMQQVAGPKGFLWITYAKNKTLYPELCGDLAKQIKQLADIRNSLDLTLSNLSKAITRNQKIDQGEQVSPDAEGTNQQ